MKERRLDLVRPLVDPRILSLVVALPLFEWLVFRRLMSAPWTKPPFWPTLAELLLRWGGHELLFVSTVFVAAGLALSGGAAKFTRPALVAAGAIAVVRAWVYLPTDSFWALDPAAHGGRFRIPSTWIQTAMFAVDPMLAAALVVAVRRHLRESGLPLPGWGRSSWPAFLLLALLSVSSLLRMLLTRSMPGGPFGFDVWMMDGPDVPVLSGAVWPGGRELLRTVSGAGATVLPAALLARWISQTSRSMASNAALAG